MRTRPAGVLRMKPAWIMRSAAVIWLACALAFAPARADDFNLDVLMQLLAQNKSGKATFVEKKYIGIIDRPVVSTGTLSFTAPGRLEKRTLTPQPEAMLLNGDILTLERAGKRPMLFNLEQHPEVSAFIESIRGTLAGDLGGLQKLYALELTGSAEAWQLVLTPKQQQVERIFSSIRISGTQAEVRTIEMVQLDGDHSVMTITPDSTGQ